MCGYCQSVLENCGGEIDNGEGEKILFELKSYLFGAEVRTDFCVIDGEIVALVWTGDRLEREWGASAKINYCPMCGRKLEGEEDG